MSERVNGGQGTGLRARGGPGYVPFSPVWTRRCCKANKHRDAATTAEFTVLLTFFSVLGLFVRKKRTGGCVSRSACAAGEPEGAHTARTYRSKDLWHIQHGWTFFLESLLGGWLPPDGGVRSPPWSEP